MQKNPDDLADDPPKAQHGRERIAESEEPATGEELGFTVQDFEPGGASS
jgi:hypothetical protein